MKKSFYALSCLAFVCILSCKKSSTSIPSTWVLNLPTGAQTCKSSSTYRNGVSLTAYDQDYQDSIRFTFPTYPTASGSYKIVPAAQLTAGNDVTFSVSDTHINAIFEPLSTDTVSANISVTAGKVTISIPSVTVSYYTFGGYAPSIQLSAVSVIEP